MSHNTLAPTSRNSFTDEALRFARSPIGYMIPDQYEQQAADITADILPGTGHQRGYNMSHNALNNGPIDQRNVLRSLPTNGQYIGGGPPNLQDLLGTARVATEDESAAFFRPDDFRWGETLTGDDSPYDQPLIHINDRKFKDAGVSDYRQKAALAESLHLLKNERPKYYNNLIDTALADPETKRWLDDSYQRVQGEGEEREFDDWLRQSRFDQVIGGYLFAGDEAFPTMKNWSRDALPFGSLRPELEKMRLLNNIE